MLLTKEEAVSVFQQKAAVAAKEPSSHHSANTVVSKMEVMRPQPMQALQAIFCPMFMLYQAMQEDSPQHYIAFKHGNESPPNLKRCWIEMSGRIDETSHQ
jgi:hypothetical protein